MHWPSMSFAFDLIWFNQSGTEWMKTKRNQFGNCEKKKKFTDIFGEGGSTSGSFNRLHLNWKVVNLFLCSCNSLLDPEKQEARGVEKKLCAIIQILHFRRLDPYQIEIGLIYEDWISKGERFIHKNGEFLKEIQFLKNKKK